MKRILLLLLVLVIGCTSFQTNDFQPEEVEDIKEAEEIEDIVSGIEDTMESEAVAAIREDGIEIVLEDVETKFIGNNKFVFYSFRGRDLLGKEQDSLEWTAYIFVTKNNLVEIPICTSQRISEVEWRSSHCIEKDVFESYGSDIRIVYTKRPLADLRALSHVKIANLDDAFLFNYTKI